ncbi:hypothetical protein ACIOKD_38310 [Streptomyces sp. NPDC087844]|uniref:hypothetical protein n=1 Tax=Streptomyces sp. NPDC087844 TaxID=3365805 RepID=UPI00381B7721
MDINGARVPVGEATEVLGVALTAQPVGRGARPALAGRDKAGLARAAQVCRSAPACNTVAFGGVAVLGDEGAEQAVAVNVLAPAASFRAALATKEPDCTIVAFTGVVAERPQAGRADCSASKAALNARLGPARREARTAGMWVLPVLPVRPGHLDTGFADRAVVGTTHPYAVVVSWSGIVPTPVVERCAR